MSAADDTTGTDSPQASVSTQCSKQMKTALYWFQASEALFWFIVIKNTQSRILNEAQGCIKTWTVEELNDHKKT